jgi:hypothetical protein
MGATLPESQVAAPVTDKRVPPRTEQPGARMRTIITAWQSKSRGGPSRPPTHVAHYARGCDAGKGAPAAHGCGH